MGKSQLAMRYTTFIADKYDINVLHLDNGEMSKEEIKVPGGGRVGIEVLAGVSISVVPEIVFEE